MTLIAVVVSLQTATPALTIYAGELAVMLLVTALSIYFTVLLSESEFSTAYIAGLLYFISFDARAFPAMTLAVFVGALIGVGALVLRSRTNPLTKMITGKTPVVVLQIAQPVVSFWLSGLVYQLAGGQLPIQTVGMIIDNLLQAVLYAVVYLGLYVLFFLIICDYSQVKVTQTDLVRMAIISVMPLPFVLLGGEIRTQLNIASSAIFIVSVVFVIIALHSVSLSEFRFRRQLQESNTLAVITQAVRSHLDLSTLLRTIYVQAAHLVDADQFTVVLTDAATRQLSTAFSVRNGQEQSDIVGKPVADKTLIGHIAETGAPLIIPSDVSLRARSMGLEAGESAVSWLGVPFQAGGQVLGVLSVSSRRAERIFNTNDLRLLISIAGSSSIAIENARLYQQQKERSEQLTILNQAAATLGANLAFDHVIDKLMVSAQMLSKANASAVFLYWDASRTALPLIGSRGLSQDFLADAPEPVSGVSIKQGQITAIENTQQDRRTEVQRPQLLGEKILSLIEIPIEAGGQMLGVLALYFRTQQHFSGDVLELYKNFANQAAQAIINARAFASADQAFQRSSEQLGALAQMGQLLTSALNEREICRLILQHAVHAAHVDFGVIALRDPQTGSLEVAAAHNTESTTLKISRVSQQAIDTRQFIRVESEHLNDYHAISHTTQSAVIIPMVRAESVIGITLLESDTTDGFSEEDAHFVHQLVNNAAIAIENARLFASIAQDRDRLRVLLDAMEEGVLLVDTSGQVTQANPAISLIGLDSRSVINQSIRSLVTTSPDLVERMGFDSVETVEKTLASMESSTNYTPVTYVIRSDRGETFIRRVIVPIHGANQEIAGLLLVFYNKTEEEQLSRSREDLARMIVHDLRSPMTAVTTSLKLLSEYAPKDNDFYPLVQTTTDASRRAIRKMMRRVDALLDVAKMENGNVELDRSVVELNKIIENVFSDLHPLANELEIELRTEIDEKMPALSVDSDKFERVLMNLVDNALKYTPAEGSITVRSTRSDEGFVRIDVIDTGPGIPDQYKQRLFDRYVQHDEQRAARRGIGLGLAFCKMVVVAHGGKIWIEDNPSGGSIFMFTAPVVPTEVLEDE